MIVHDLSHDAVERMSPAVLAGRRAEPGSRIGDVPFNECTGGIGCFRGQPPWERHPGGDELLHVLAGSTTLTVLEGATADSRLLHAGDLTVVPRGRWHRNDAPDGVTLLFVTPSDGNEHSWTDPR